MIRIGILIVPLSQSGKDIVRRCIGSIYWNTSSGDLLYHTPTLRFIPSSSNYSILADPGQGGTYNFNESVVIDVGESWTIVLEFSNESFTLKTGTLRSDTDINVGSLTYTYQD